MSIMLCDVLRTVAKLHGSLQSKELDIATVPVMVESTVKRLRELKENTPSSTWFKDHVAVFTESTHPKFEGVTVSETEKESFLSKIYIPSLYPECD